MKRLALLVLLMFQLHGASYSSIGPSFYIAQAYNSSTNTVFAAWIDESSDQIFYATYTDVDQWSTSCTIDPNATSFTPPALCYDPRSGTILLAWTDFDSGFPMYSVYDNTRWSTPQQISATQQCYVLIGLSLTDSEIVATWMNQRNNCLPIYATYVNGIWNEASEITLDPKFRARRTVLSSYDEANQSLVAVWESFFSNQPLYATYKQGTWTTPDAIIPSSEVVGDRIPTYAIYRNGSWITAHYPATASSTFESDVLLVYNPLNQELFASWEDSYPFSPIYAIFQNDNWRDPEPSPVPTPVPDNKVDAPPLLLDSVRDLTVENLTCKQQRHHFGFVTEWYNMLTWAANPSFKVAGYHIYRNRIRIASVPANVLSYQDHNQKRRDTVVYHVTIFDKHGNESPATKISTKKR